MSLSLSYSNFTGKCRNLSVNLASREELTVYISDADDQTASAVNRKQNPHAASPSNCFLSCFLHDGWKAGNMFSVTLVCQQEWVIYTWRLFLLHAFTIEILFSSFYWFCIWVLKILLCKNKLLTRKSCDFFSQVYIISDNSSNFQIIWLFLLHKKIIDHDDTTPCAVILTISTIGTLLIQSN